MKVILVGASGVIGRHLEKIFVNRFELVRVGSKSGDIHADITSVESIRQMYATIGEFDAMVCAAGEGYFGPFERMKDTEFRKGVDSKLMGQINLVLEGISYIRPEGSFTLTSGILADDPVPMSSNLAAINGALNAFVGACAMELKNGVRINVVSPGLVEDSAITLGGYFPGHLPVPMYKVIAAYVKSLEGAVNGQVIRVF